MQILSLFIFSLESKLSTYDRCMYAIKKYQNKEFQKQIKEQMFEMYSSFDFYFETQEGII